MEISVLPMKSDQESIFLKEQLSAFIVFILLMMNPSVYDFHNGQTWH